MSIFDNLYFWRKKKEPEKIIIPYKQGIIPIKNNTENMYENLKPIDLAKIEPINFPKDHYFQEVYKKKQIVIHHTISGLGINGDVSTWEGGKDRIATCIIIDRGGTPWQLFSSRYWAYHLGTKNKNLNKYSIGIELDSWGGLIPTDDGKYKTYYGNKIHTVVEYYPNGFRGYNYFEKYTEAQIITLGELMLYWNKVYNIPLTYHEDMWDVTQSALDATPGVYGHTSFRPYPEKSDPHPQPTLIDMLKTLDGIK